MTTLTDQQRTEKRAADLKEMERAVEALRTSEGWQRWLSMRRHFRQYSLNNQMLIALQKPEATRVAGFRAWLKLGYCVSKGEHAIRIWVPITPSKKQRAELEARGEKPWITFRMGPVFDRSQVHALPPPAEPADLDIPIVEIDGDELGGLLEVEVLALAEELDVDFAIVERPPGHAEGGWFRLSDKTIRVYNDCSLNSQVHTAVHELAHALCVAEKDDGLMLDYAQEELIVESVTFSVMGSLGIDVSGFAVPYLTSWSEKTDVKVIQATAVVIDLIATRLEKALESAPVAQLAA